MLKRALRLSAVFACMVACGTGEPGSPAGAPTDVDQTAWDSDPPAVYVAKVKNVLVGLPPTDDEVKAVVADPNALRALIDGWMKLPQYRDKMQRFFQLAFQQAQVSVTDFADQAFPRQIDVNGSTQALLVQDATESFARTALALTDEGRPFHETMTTTRFMMTPALMELYAFLDAWHVDDDGKVTDRFRAANPKATVTLEAAQGPIPIEQSTEPTSASFLHFYDPDLANATVTAKFAPGCAEDPITIPATGMALHMAIWGAIENHQSAGGARCNQFGGTAAAPQIQPADFTAWKMVTIRRPKPGEKPTQFWDLPKLRTANELVLAIPRVGFFSTPAFFANWSTNISNQMRVTVNQSLIVATGAAIDGTDTTLPDSSPGLDSQHADPKLGCVGCHRLLDPTRSILSATYTWNYHEQLDATLTAQKGLFAFQGVIKDVATIEDFANTLATHPLFGQAWAQKLCYYASSLACETDDPEFQRVVGVFKDSGWSWPALVRELLASPLTTHAARTKTVQDAQGGVVAVSRRDHLCAAWNGRFGLDDVCGLDVQKKGAAAQQAIPEIVSGLPSDGYGRGAVAPVLPNSPTLFYRAGTENICEAIAAALVDAQKPPAGAKTWSSGQPDAAIADFVHLVMGLPGADTRAAPAQALLASHYQAAIGTGATPTDALRSTFVVACTAPSATAIGL